MNYRVGIRAQPALQKIISCYAVSGGLICVRRIVHDNAPSLVIKVKSMLSAVSLDV